MMSEMGLTIHDLEYSHPGSTWRLRVSDFHLPKGEFQAVIGPNGSGKSTFLRLAAGLLRPQRGEVLVQGQNLKTIERKVIARILGYLPAEPSSEFDYSVFDVVAMGRYPYLPLGGFMRSEDMRHIETALAMTEMEALKDRPVSHLSDGERQRAFLASVLAQEPSILLLDEPTSALDIHHQVQFFRILRDLAGNGISILLVLHDINMASLYADRITLFKDGRIEKSGTPDEVLTERDLSCIYGEDLLVIQHPGTERPIALPRAKGGADAN